MAVVQISRIQVRRGKKQETGLPQLASGEIAWAVDTQELYIGNGSVSEGSPAVGNTKILTQNDLTIQGNLLALLQHIYKAEDTSIQTGPETTNPTTRSVQDRLDDHVSVLDFGAIGNGVADDTAAFQRAIDQLYFNPNTVDKAYNDNYLSNDSAKWSASAVTARRILEIPAGKYNIENTLTIPSYATIVGAGADKTILQFLNAGTAIEFVDDGTDTLQFNTQARFVTLRGLTIYTNTSDQIALDMYAVRDSQLSDIILRGSWAGSNENSIGIKISNYLNFAVSERNTFNNIAIHGFTYGIFATSNISNNIFTNGHIYDTKQGVVFGKDADGFTPGQQTGPVNNTFDNFNFEAIKQHAVYVEKGKSNTVKNSRLTQVGEDGGGVSGTSYPQIYFTEFGNSSENNSSDRWSQLSNSNLTVPYLPEVAGWVSSSSYGSFRIDLGTIPGPTSALAFRLPLSTDSGGAPRGNIMYVVDYLYQSTTNNFSRRGTLTISANVDLTFIKLSDEYDYAGPPDPSLESAINLDFSARFKDINNLDIDPSDLTPNDPWTIAVKYVNPLDTGIMTYSYKAVQSYVP